MKPVWRVFMLAFLAFGLYCIHAQEPVAATGNATPDSSVPSVEQAVWSPDVIEQHAGSWGSRPVFGIELWRYVALLVALLLTFLGARIARWLLRDYLLRLAARTHWRVDDLVLEGAVEPTSLFLTVLGVYVAVMFVMAGHAPAMLQLYFRRICCAVAAGAILWYAYRLVGIVDHLLRRFARRTDTEFDDSFIDVMRKTLRVFVLVVGAMVIGKNVLKWDITALLASAGVVGLAVAFAAQDTVANFFGTLMLLLDKPFRVGERVVIDGMEGPVEAIGFRSTRIRTLDGHQVTIPNKIAANVTIENVGRRLHIKRVSNIGITYDTPVAKVEKALTIIREILKDHKGMDPELPPRVHFNEFCDCSLNIVVYAWYHPGDHWEYLEWSEQVNLEIMRRFEAEGIEFAFPTTTTYLAQDDRRALTIRTAPTPAQGE